MKKYIAILLVFMLLTISFTGCSAIGKKIANSIKDSQSGNSDNGGEQEEAQPEAAQDKPAQESGADKPVLGGVGFDNPSDSYAKYTELKSAAYDRINDKLSASEDPEIAMASMSLLPVIMSDLTLLPLTVLTADQQAAGIALSMLGMKDVKIAQNSKEYTITYANEDGDTFTQTCVYDKATDSMQSTLSGSKSDGETMYFEYTRAGKGYASQMFSKNDDGGYTLVLCFFDDSNIAAFGVKSVDSKPASIIGSGASLNKDFVKNDEMYAIFEVDALTIMQDGTEKTI